MRGLCESAVGQMVFAEAETNLYMAYWHLSAMGKAHWKPYITGMPMQFEDGIQAVPIFGWSYETDRGLVSGGQIYAWAHEGYFSFTPTQSDYDGPKEAEDPSKLVQAIEEFYRWDGELPHLGRVREDIRRSSLLFKGQKLAAFKRECVQLEARWKGYLANQSN